MLLVSVFVGLFHVCSSGILVDHGGPKLNQFFVHQFFYGSWAPSDITRYTNYMRGSCYAITGANAPFGKQFQLVQYGTSSCGLGQTYKEDTGKTHLTHDEAEGLLNTAIQNKHLPAWSSSNLYIVYIKAGLDPHCAYHNAYQGQEGKYYGFISNQCGPDYLVHAHELYEASSDPCVNCPGHVGWDENTDDCSTSTTLWYGSTVGIWSNMAGGKCSTTCYDTIPPRSVPGHFVGVWNTGSISNDPEIQLFGVTYDVYRKKYDEIWGFGWRLSLLNVYVSNDVPLYSAVWKNRGGFEKQFYGWAAADIANEHKLMQKGGWQIDFICPYVTSTGKRYTIVYKHGTSKQALYLGDSKKTFESRLSGQQIGPFSSFAVNSNVFFAYVLTNKTASSKLQDHMLAVPYATYRAHYDSIYPSKFFRLDSISTVRAGSQIYYSAVWDKQAEFSPELQHYGDSYDYYGTSNDDMNKNGKNLKLLSVYV